MQLSIKTASYISMGASKHAGNQIFAVYVSYNLYHDAIASGRSHQYTSRKIPLSILSLMKTSHLVFKTIIFGARLAALTGHDNPAST
jgi:hypothetical protein